MSAAANIRTHRNTSEEPLFVTWEDGDERGRSKAMSRASAALSRVDPTVRRNLALGGAGWPNVETNVNVRSGFNRLDYEFFRPEERVPREYRNIIWSCMSAYEQTGILYTIINLMSDFSCRGLELVHQNKRIEVFYQEWAKKVHLNERAERFMNLLYRCGNVLVKRDTAKLKDSDIQRLQRGIAQSDYEVDTPVPIVKGELPWYYTFISPLAVEILGGEELSIFAGSPLYGLRIPDKIAGKIKNPKTNEEAWLVNQLPDYIINPVRNGEKLIPLDPNKVSAYYYKKDDWQLWATPMAYPVLNDLIMLNKMKLADLAALDGAISHIRLWKLGDMANRILPTPAGIERLANILMNLSGGQGLDLVWGPDLDFKETSTEIYKFLGSQKYEPILSAIYTGLGVPTASQGGSAGRGGGGNLDKYLSLKILTERLNYGRTIFNQFINQEIRIVQQAMGFRFPAQPRYEFMVLTDEDVYRRLLIELVDRDIMSIETVQERFGEIPELEEIRIRREHQRRDSGKVRPKAGPYHNARQENDLEKIFAQTGVVTPSEVGLDLDPRKRGEKSMLDMKLKATKVGGGGGNPNGNPNVTAEPAGTPGEGRPPGSKDTMPRKQKQVKPSAAANYFNTRAWATEIQNTISIVVTPIFLQAVSKKNVRSLTEEEFNSLENFKFAILCTLKPFAEFSEKSLAPILAEEIYIPYLMQQLLAKVVGKFTEQNAGRPPNIEQTRMFQAEVYSIYVQSDMETLDGDE